MREQLVPAKHNGRALADHRYSKGWPSVHNTTAETRCRETFRRGMHRNTRERMRARPLNYGRIRERPRDRLDPAAAAAAAPSVLTWLPPPRPQHLAAAVAAVHWRTAAAPALQSTSATLAATAPQLADTRIWCEFKSTRPPAARPATGSQPTGAVSCELILHRQTSLSYPTHLLA